MQKLFLIMLLTLSTTSMQGASVKKLLKKSKKIVIDEGKKTGFTKGKTACVYDNDGQEITCAKIYKAKKKKSYMRIKKRKIFKKIAKGMTIRLEGEEPQELTPTESGPKGATNIKIGYVLSPVTPSSYNAIYYADPNETPVNTFWKADRVSNLSLTGLGIELGFGVWDSKLNLGMRLRSYKPFTIRANYTPDRANFAETNLTATSQGFWIDFNYLIFDFGLLTLDLGNGIDIDFAKLDMDTYAKNDNNDDQTEIYSASSTFTTISLRTNLNFNFFFDPIGFQLSSSFLIPVSGTATDSITINDPQVTDYLNGSGEDDVRQALNHKKSSFGLEMFVTFYYAF